MNIHGSAARLTIYVNETTQWCHRPAYTEIVRRAHAAGLAGATVLRGVEGYGTSGHVHTTRILSLTEDLPMVVVIVDDEDRIRDFLPQVEEVVDRGLAVVETVETYRYRDGDHEPSHANGRRRRRGPRLAANQSSLGRWRRFAERISRFPGRRPRGPAELAGP